MKRPVDDRASARAPTVQDRPSPSGWRSDGSAGDLSADLLAETVPGIVFRRVMDRDGRLSYPYLSPSVKTYVGYDAAEVKIALDGSLDFIHWADRDMYLRRVHDSASTGQRCHEEFRAIDRTGEVRWLLGSSLPRRTDDGIVWDGTLVDVTDRKRAEQWLGMIMDHAADVIVTMNDDGMIEQTNAASRDVFGRDPDDLIGKPASVLMPQLEQGDLVDMLRRYLLTGETTLVGAGPREMLGRHANDTLFPIEVLVSEVLTEGRRLFIGVVRDITQRKDAENALQESQRRLTTIAENLQGLVFQRVLHADGRLEFLYISGATLNLIGQPPAAVIQDSDLLLNAMPQDHRDAFMTALRTSARTLRPMEDDYKLIGRGGTERWLRGWSRPQRTDDGAVVWEGVALDVTDRKQAESRLMFLAYHDPMTGLGNRSLLLEHFRNRKAASAGPNGTQTRIAVLSVGLERLSFINATVGHAIGDRVLLAVSHRLREFLGPDRTLYRSGGGRFLAMIPDCGDDAHFSALLDRMVELFQTPVEVDGHLHDLSINIGASLYPLHAPDAESLIMHADAALHEAKRNGSGLHRLYTPELGKQASRVVTLRQQMRVALERREFRAFFQPQLDLATNRVVGTEALARWITEDGTLVSPGDFIPIAEEYGLIDDICVQVLEDACRWTARWNTMGLGPISVAVNISARQFHTSSTLTEIVDHSLHAFGLAPELLELELTESTAMSDPDNASRVIRMFTERGIGCSIDDFGTGYSSLSLLKRFALRKLKIDQSFVNDVTNEPNDAAICSAIIAMAHAMGLKVCAEGVETQGQLEFLRAQNCDKIQGFLISRPLPPEDLERLLAGGEREISARIGAPAASHAIPSP